MRFAHIADVHLGRRVDSGTSWEKDACREIYDGLAAFVDHIELNPVDFIFITGDLFDHVPDRDELAYADELFARLPNVSIIYVTGECDCLIKGADIWNYKFISNMYILNLSAFNNNVKADERGVRAKYTEGIADCIYFEKYNLDIYGVCQYNSYNPRNDLDTIYVHKPERLNILLAHGGDAEVESYDPEDMKAKKFDYIGMGHFHTYTEYKDANIYYPGSLEPLSAAEEGRHGYIRGYIDGLLTDIRFVPLACRRYKTIELETDSYTTNDELVEKVNDICARNKGYIYTVVIRRNADGFIDFDLSSLRKKYRILEITGEKVSVGDLDVLEKLNADNPLGKVLKHLRESGSEFAYEARVRYAFIMSEQLWGNNNPDMEPQTADYAKAENMYHKICGNLKNELVQVQKGLDVCECELKKLEGSLVRYPDLTGEINVARAELHKVEYEDDLIRFADEQVDKIYDRKRLGLVLLMDVPIVILILLAFLWMPRTYVLMRWNAWFGIVIVLFIALVGVTAFSYAFYGGSRWARKRLFGIKTPEEKHASNRTRRNDLAKLKDDMEEHLKRLETGQKEHLEILSQIKEIQIRNERLVRRFQVIELILSK